MSGPFVQWPGPGEASRPRPVPRLWRAEENHARAGQIETEEEQTGQAKTAASVTDDSVPATRGETSLYLPVKRFLESFGFSVKGEIGGCDMVGLSGDAPPFVVVCELKMQFNLELVLQAVDRAAACDEVWLAARLSNRAGGRARGRANARAREDDPRFRALCRRLGFGLLGVGGNGAVEVLLKPTAPPPRRDPRRRSRLVDEHRRRHGDPTAGGASRRPIMTAYRQEALRCAALLAAGPRRVRDLKPASPNAQKILRRNVYGWFARAERGVYGLTEAGHAAAAAGTGTDEPAV